jgi:hypothetical protein
MDKSIYELMQEKIITLLNINMQNWKIIANLYCSYYGIPEQTEQYTLIHEICAEAFSGEKGSYEKLCQALNLFAEKPLFSDAHKMGMH